MKKYLILGFVLLAISCSSDDDEPSDINLQIQQKEVNLSFHVDELNKMMKDYNGCHRVYYPPTPDAEIGHLGIYVYKQEDTFFFFDGVCPVEIYNKSNELWTVNLKHTDYGNRFECNGCKSIYSGITLEPNSGRAKDLGLHLIKYQATISDDGMYHISNPNYKK